ncbi:MAG: putative low-affinity inorganic phosphate transporter [Actinomycetota bacterium]
MDYILWTTIITIALALIFDFSNGFHDAANATSTVIATKSLKPRTAVIVSAVFNFLPAFVIGTAVANTISKTVNLDSLPAAASNVIPFGLRVTLAALLGAIFWNFFTWAYGLPSSSSHALIGGLLGAGISAGGIDAVSWSTVQKTVVAIFLSPIVAFLVAIIASWIIRLAKIIFKLDDNHEFFRWGQIFSSAFVSWGHGSNDAQKTMGIMAAALYSAGYLQAEDGSKLSPSTWVIFAAQFAIAIGTFYGGWRIIETMGLKITHITRASGLAANLGAITSINGATHLGIPISTTHAAATSVIGSGIGSGHKVHLKTIGRMMGAWVVTLPSAGVVGYITYKATVLPGVLAGAVTGLLIVALLAYAIRLMFTATTAEDVERALPQDVEQAIPMSDK